MKFQLFGRLRGDDNDADGSSNSGGSPNVGDEMPSQGPPSSPESRASPGNDFSVGGNNLERTVENMFSQGYSQDEIKDELRGQYSPDRIEQAVNSAVATSATGQQEGPQPMTPYKGENEAVSPVDQGFNDDMPQGDNGPDNDTMTEPNNSGPEGSPPGQQQPQPLPQPNQTQQEANRQAENSVDPEVEELIETIIAENLQRVESEFEHVYQEIDEIKETVEDLEERVHDLEVRDDEDQEQFIQKMNEMEEHIDSYQSRIGGLEKAFQQVLPSLVDNVRDLTDLVQEIKAERGIDTEKNVSQQDIEDIDMDDWN